MACAFGFWYVSLEKVSSCFKWLRSNGQLLELVFLQVFFHNKYYKKTPNLPYNEHNSINQSAKVVAESSRIYCGKD